MENGSGATGGCVPKRGVSVPLQVINPAPKLKKSRVSPWRFGVLIGVHVLMIAHIIHWRIAKTTLTPIEPSESMTTLEFGKLNAGFVFFAIALLSTFLFGRVFCGWGCHIIALQDTCTVLLKKFGIRPKPWRSRLLVLVPTILALYMFVWPTFKREALAPFFRWIQFEAPFWLAPPPPRPNFQPAFMTDDFWATFGPWWMAPPFLLVCGFLIVYVIGSKGFCTYGCPYGGFFAPLDKLSLARIEVNDNCNQCGHCTAACDSNVRVHQEVKDFGRVVDPGCMKCFDCVSACPNDALKYSFGLPSLFTRAKTPEAQAGNIRRPEYDMSLAGELLVGLVGWILFCGFRGMLDRIPLLMALGLAACFAFGLWKVAQLFTVQNVRFHNFQLRSRGKLQRSGIGFTAVVLAGTAVSVWGVAHDVNSLIGDYHDTRIKTPESVVLTPDYKPSAEDLRHAEAGIAALLRTAPPSEGGWGWKLDSQVPARLVWLHVVKKDLPGAEHWMRRSMEYPDANENLAMSLTLVMALQGKGPEEINTTAAEIIKQHPRMYRMRFGLASKLLENQDIDGALALARQPENTDNEAPATAFVQTADLFASCGAIPDAFDTVEKGLRNYPKFTPLVVARAQLQFSSGNVPDAVASMRAALAIEPENPNLLGSVAGLLRGTAQSQGHPEWLTEAEALEKRAAEIRSRAQQQPPQPR